MEAGHVARRFLLKLSKLRETQFMNSELSLVSERVKPP